MMMDPWERIKQDWPAVFTATTASLLAVTIFQSGIGDLTKLAFWKMFLSVVVSVLAAIIIVYVFVYFVIHKLRHRVVREEMHAADRLRGKRKRF